MNFLEGPHGSFPLHDEHGMWMTMTCLDLMEQFSSFVGFPLELLNFQPMDDAEFPDYMSEQEGFYATTFW
jgi:hypothetical protein